jgi:hypothetical protein
MQKKYLNKRRCCTHSISNIIMGIVGLKINKAAVMALPKPLQVFFYNHIDFITQESTVPFRKSVLKIRQRIKTLF